MPEGRPGDELIAMQRNLRKDGSPFNNMFYLKVFNLGADPGKERPYIVALQSELPDGIKDLAAFAKNMEVLDARMAKVKRELSANFFMQQHISRQSHSSMSAPASQHRQEERDDALAPSQLHGVFPPAEVQSWDPSR